LQFIQVLPATFCRNHRFESVGLQLSEGVFRPSKVVLFSLLKGVEGEEYREKEGRASVSPKFLSELVYSPPLERSRQQVYHLSSIFWIEVILLLLYHDSSIFRHLFHHRRVTLEYPSLRHVSGHFSHRHNYHLHLWLSK